MSMRITASERTNEEINWITHSTKYNCGDYIFDGDEDWELNVQIYEKLRENINDDLNPEEKAIRLYENMLRTFYYDDNYFYTDSESDGEKIDQTRMESIKVGSKINCFDFARIYTRMITLIGDDNIKAIVLNSKSISKHFAIGVRTPKCMFQLEPVRRSRKNGGLNDFVNVRMGFDLQRN